ncbi:hypothetical protein JCM17844_13540 [Iodidimonas gelatinilytica]|uniref:ZIP family metal transporter n=1 Tax=Iodidimonas gelatinilytica TaxID=1236966 RepID=A0A5A7MP27_9PROT|nr:ZIP family metal transporter [Iodidimonas gelatinilytica]GEQ97717.1 hypothetical protein JCM17844_13540 [Iodidimonas gelatinilytica]GER00980.1 hypothetical protein JCM17845_16030 [Iodidimonas gelatinilytica]
MMDSSSFALAFSMLAALVNLGGLLVIRHYEAWGNKNSVLFAAFAAGFLIGAAILQVIPKALSMVGQMAPLLVLAGYVLMYCLGLLSAHKNGTSHMDKRAMALIPIFGIALHSFSDGLSYSAAFSVDVFTGVTAVFGLVLHEFSEGIIAFVLLLRGGFSPHRAMITAFFAAAATTPLGTAISLPFISQLSGVPLGSILAVTGGALLYVGASHLVPHVEHTNRRGSAFAFFGGLSIMVLMQLFHHS